MSSHLRPEATAWQHPAVAKLTTVKGKELMTGDDLQQLLIDKWGYSYDMQLRRTQGKLFVQVMWRYLEQVSFPMSDGEYGQHLDAIAAHISEWGVAEQVRQFIQQTRTTRTTVIKETTKRYYY